MEWTRVVLDFVASVAWPIVAVVGLVMFGGRLRKILDGAQLRSLKFKAGGVEADIGIADEVESARAKVRDIPDDDVAETFKEDIELKDETTNDRGELGLVGPVINAAELLSAVLRSAIADVDPNAVNPRRGPQFHIETARKLGLLTSDEAAAAMELIAVRNKVAHGVRAGLTQAIVDDYVATVVDLDQLARSRIPTIRQERDL